MTDRCKIIEVRQEQDGTIGVIFTAWRVTLHDGSYSKNTISGYSPVPDGMEAEEAMANALKGWMLADMYDSLSPSEREDLLGKDS